MQISVTATLHWVTGNATPFSISSIPNLSILSWLDIVEACCYQKSQLNQKLSFNIKPFNDFLHADRNSSTYEKSKYVLLKVRNRIVGKGGPLMLPRCGQGCGGEHASQSTTPTIFAILKIQCPANPIFQKRFGSPAPTFWAIFQKRVDLIPR